MQSTIEEERRPSRAYVVVATLSFVWLFACGCAWIQSGTMHRADGLRASVFFGLVLGAPAFVAALVTFVVLARRLLRGRSTSVMGLTVSVWAIAGGLLTYAMLYSVFLDRVYPSSFSHGRRLHRGRRLLAPRATAGDGWLCASTFPPALDVPVLDVPQVHREGIAAQWRDNAAKEHASIAAFAHLTLDLMAVGAPARLVLGAQAAAQDECRHAELAYTLAARIDGRKESPAPFPDALARRTLAPLREVALAQLAVDALSDGVLNEGIASRILARLAKQAGSRELASLLFAVAADEARHARHSWDVIEWCLAEGGGTVAHALEKARATMPAHLGSPLPPDARDGSWTPWGVQGVALEVAEYAVVRRATDRRLASMLEVRRAA